MNERVQRALTQDRTVDITTIGRRSGQARRIEIWFHNLDSRIYISGLSGRRGWCASGLLAGLGREGELEDWVDRSPLIEVELKGRGDARSA